MHWKSPYGSWCTGSRKSMIYLSFLFRFLVITFYNFCCIFTLYHYSAICWDFMLSLICLNMCVILLFIILIILFVYDGGRYETAATSGAELLVTIIHRFQSLPFVMGDSSGILQQSQIHLFCCSFFSVNNILVCLGVSFS